MSETMIEATVTACKHLGYNANGNPRFEITTDRGVWRTRAGISDAAKFSADTIVGNTVRMTIDGRGSVRGIDIQRKDGSWR